MTLQKEAIKFRLELKNLLFIIAKESGLLTFMDKLERFLKRWTN